MPTTPDTYRCAACKQEFAKGWSAAEATAELQERFGDFAPADCDVLCDDCYKRLFGEPEAQP